MDFQMMLCLSQPSHFTICILGHQKRAISSWHCVCHAGGSGKICTQTAIGEGGGDCAQFADALLTFQQSI